MSAVESVTSVNDQRTTSDSLMEAWTTDSASTLVEFNLAETPGSFPPNPPDPETVQELPLVSPSNDTELEYFRSGISPMTFLDGVNILPATWDLPFDFPTSDLDTLNGDGLEKPNYLTKINLSSTFAQQSADLIMEALYAIPQQMLRLETLPPFIHPHWHLPALPEALAICMQIANMYSLNSQAIRAFVWRSILAEQRRALQRLNVLSDKEVLAETQAGMVYLMMRLVDGVMRDLEWTREMLAIQDALCTRFLEINNFCFCLSEESHPSLTWEDWIYAESRRRTSLVWFLITRTIVMQLRPNCSTTDAPGTLPLPAPKSQWEARTGEDWMKEVGLEAPAITTIGDLIVVKQQVRDQKHMHMLGAYNARMDGLGLLVNIAVAMV